MPAGQSRFPPLPCGRATTSQAGWTKREGGDKAGDTGEPYTPAASLTLYARWTPVFTVSFDLDGAGTPPDALSVAEGGPITLPAVSRQDYRFDGWYTEEGDKAGDAGEPYIPAASLTLYAHWTQDLPSILTGFPANTEDSPHTISIAAETDVCGDDWAGINDAVRSAGKYVILDLSDCGASLYTGVYGNGPFIKG
ncbi:MAG: InlB B-repeat-containing protein [Treponematales bacterium]